MRKYSINTTPSNVLRFNAGAKPRYDALRTMSNNGYEILEISAQHCVIPYINRISLFSDFIRKTKSICRNDIVVIQYPFLFYNDFLEYKAIKSLCKKCDNVTFFIHDIGFLRNGENFKKEIRLLNLPSRIIVHSDKMANEVKKFMTANVTIDVLGLFDYYSDASLLSTERLLMLKNYIAFAGNLQKSIFLKQLSQLSDEINWILYGASWEGDDCSDNIFYAGKFMPDNPTILESGWGLVWDGDSIKTCEGFLGNYLKFNSPHKFSLYLSRGIPVIVWKGSALSQFVEDEKIGITINSLHEIEEKLKQLSLSDYESIIINARKIGEKIRKGYFLSKII